MKLYLGVDLHKRSCWITVMDSQGRILESQRIGTERATLLSYFGQVEKPAALAVEATFNWYYFLDTVEPLGLELHLVHPWKTRAIASARIKHDKLDSRILAELLRTGFLAEAWIAPREVRQQRQLLRYRAQTVRCATRAKNAVHGIVNRNGAPSPVESLFGPKGRAFLKEVVLPELDRWEVDGQLARLDLLEQQIRELDREIRQRVKADPVAEALKTIPGIGPFIALLLVAEIGDLRRFPSAKHLASYTGLVPSLYASAEHRWGGPITKQGSSLLRWALVQAAHTAARSPRFVNFYQRQQERHGTGKAVVALARKLAVISYYRWRAVKAQPCPR
ncbi:MAG: IS110 family transposase [Terriglobia bacterium]